MPHTNHRKKQTRTKRITVTDDNGWSRVTTVNGSRPKLPTTTSTINPSIDHSAATPAKGITIEKLYSRYQEIEKRWHESDSWKSLDTLLQNTVAIETIQSIQNAIVFGTGSFCGAGNGWIERFEVSLYQLAAFKAVLDKIEAITGQRPLAQAQEPVYNDIDTELLARLNILKVDHPTGFQAITPQTFVYAPCAELAVEISCLAANPSLAMLTGNLDFHWRNDDGEVCTNRQISINSIHESVGVGVAMNQASSFPSGGEVSSLQSKLKEQLKIMERFQDGKASFALPDLDVKDFPFHDVHLFAKISIEDED